MPKRKTNKGQKRSDAKPKKKESQKSKMMMSMQIALIAGGIAFGVAGYLISFGHHKISSIWFLFAGVVLSSLGGALYLHAQALPDVAPQDSIPSPSVPPSTPTTAAMPNQPINISSVNQSGGITAHTVTSVNIGDRKRGIQASLSDRIRDILKDAPKNDVEIETIMDGECQSFAGSIGGALELGGIKIVNMITSLGAQFKGVTIHATSESAMKQAAAIRQVLTLAGYDSVVSHVEGRGDLMAITVGPIR